MARLLRRLGAFCARHGLIVIGIWVAARHRCRRRRRHASGPRRTTTSLCPARQPGGQGPARGAVPAAAERHQPDRLRRRRRASSPTRRTSRRSTRRSRRSASAARLQRHQPAQQRRPDRRPVLEGRADGVRARAARHRLGRADRGDRPGGPRRDRACAGRRHQRRGRRLDRLELSDRRPEISEVVGIIAAMIILSLVLGSLVAMGLPIITAVVGLGVALATVGLLGHVVAMPSSGPTLATMIGLGVGIDYALFLITRHQDQLATGMPMRRVDRARGRHVGQRHRVRGRHGRRRPALAGRRRHPAA